MEEYNNYKDWFNNDDSKRKVLEGIKLSGMPLELKTRKIFREKGYDVTSAYYSPSTEQKEELREIDIYAIKQEKGFSIDDFQVNFNFLFVGECKYSGISDILIFEYGDTNNLIIDNLPLFVNGHRLIKLLPQVRTSKYFGSPLFAEKAIQVNAAKPYGKKEYNYSNKLVHDACEQITMASNFYFNRRGSFWRDFYNNTLNSPFFGDYKKALADGKIRSHEDGFTKMPVEEDVAEFFKKINKKMLGLLGLCIDVFFHVLIFDESRGIMKVKTDELCNPKELEPIDYCIYLHTPVNLKNYDIFRESYSLPIIICNPESLRKVISDLEKSMRSIINELENQLNSNPHTIPLEFLSDIKMIHG